MPRPPRLQYPGSIHHLVPRGDGRRTLFHDDGHYARFTQGLSDEVSRSGLLWMPNHVHALIKRPSQICAVVRSFGFRDMRTGTPNEIDGLLQRCENCPNDLD